MNNLFALLMLLSSGAFAAPFSQTPNTVMKNPHQLTFQGPRSGEGYFSADGKKMIFQSEREPGNPFYQMFVMDLKTGESQRVSPGKGKTTCGWVHPSGKKVMWSSTHLDPKKDEKVREEYENRAKPVKGRYSWSYDDTFDIFESDLNGKNIKQLTHEKGYDAEGSYSPDGKWIAFASNRAGYSEKLSPEDAAIFAKDQSYMMDIYIMKSDGKDVKRLTNVKGYDGGPFFSPDGKKIVWRRFAPSGATAEVYIMNIDGSDQKPLTHLGAMSWAPYFHPSGDYVIFTSSVISMSNFQLFIVDLEGKKDPIRVSFNEGFDGLPVFTPDGNQIAWTHKNEKGESQIYRADWDDAQARKLLDLPTRNPGPEGLSSEIREADLRRLVEWMASPEMKGRQTGSPEEKILTQKWAELFKSWGLVGGAPDGSFFQNFTFTSSVKLGNQNRLDLQSAESKSLKIGTDVEPYSFSAAGEIKRAALVFAGYGIRAPATEKQTAYDSYKDLDVKGKWVVVLRDLPEDLPQDRRYHLNLYARLQHKITVAREAGAQGLLILEGITPLKPLPNRALRFEGALAASSLPALRAGGSWVEGLFKQANQKWSSVKGALDKGEMTNFAFPPSISLQGYVDLVQETSTGTNVIAKLPGGHSKGHAILLGAHGDHLGHGESGSSLAKGPEQGQVHYGADDNASGVAALLETAHFLSDYKKAFAQDLYFAVWSGEEIGLLGSAAFVREWEKQKKKPVKDTFTAVINMDMVGRLRDQLQLQGVASGDHWSSLAETLSLRSNIPMVLTGDPYLPTDSMTFYLAGIPAINFFTGAHAEYHSPRDTAETLNYPGLEKITAAVAALTSTLAHNPKAMVQYQKVAGNPNGHLEGRSFRTYLGTVPDYAAEGIKGVLLSAVTKDSPAQKAGLQEKDVIIELAGIKIENLYDYVYALQAVKPGEETLMKINRKGKSQEIKITPQLKE